MAGMRGTDFQQSAMFSYLSPEQRVPADHPLRAIRQITDKVLKQLSRLFSRMYSQVGRPSIPPEKLLRALLLQALYTIRSERMLMEELNYNLLFRWFVGLNLDDEVWDVTVFTKNRERLLKAEVASRFFHRVVKEPQALDRMSDEHFTVDGTLLEACASLKSFKKVEEGGAEERVRGTIPAIPRWTSTGRSAATRHINRRPIRRRSWRGRERAKKRS